MATTATVSKTSTTEFATLVEKLPFSPKTSEGAGFLPIFLRTLIHVAYALGITEDEIPKDKTVTDKKATEVLKKIKTEITDALAHCNNIQISDNLSSVARDQLAIFNQTLTALDREFESWDRDSKITNLTSLYNRGVGISAMLDRELIGLRHSDPGTSL